MRDISPSCDFKEIFCIGFLSTPTHYKLILCDVADRVIQLDTGSLAAMDFAS